MSDFYTVKEFAAHVGMHPNTVRRLIKKGKINACQMGIGCKAIYRIPITEMNRLAYDHLEIVIGIIVDKKIVDKN